MKVNQGFTLIELLITLGVISIITSIAVPSLGGMVQSARITTVVSKLERTIRFARREAILGKLTVSICPSSDGEFCNRSYYWSGGWIVYIDKFGNSSRQIDDPILRVEGPHEEISIRYNRSHRLSFNSLGRIHLNGSLLICDPTNQVDAVRLVMIHSGRLRREQSKDNKLCD